MSLRVLGEILMPAGFFLFLWLYIKFDVNMESYVSDMITERRVEHDGAYLWLIKSRRRNSPNRISCKLLTGAMEKQLTDWET